MLKKIESIRKKPKETRMRYAFWLSAIFTALIAGFWAGSLPSQLSFLDGSKQDEQKVDGSIIRSFSNLRASVSDGVDMFRSDILNDSQQLIDESPAVPQSDDVKEEIDISNILNQVNTSKEEAAPARRVLIGTSTAASTDRE